MAVPRVCGRTPMWRLRPALPTLTFWWSALPMTPTVARHSVVYGFFDVLGRATSLLLLPLYTNVMTPPEYGVLEIFTVTQALLQSLQRFCLALFGLSRALHQLLVSRFGSLGHGRVEPLGGLAQCCEPLARAVHRLLIDFGDLADGLLHTLFQRRYGGRPKLCCFAFAAADRFRDARSFFA